MGPQGRFKQQEIIILKQNSFKKIMKAIETCDSFQYLQDRYRYFFCCVQASMARDTAYCMDCIIMLRHPQEIKRLQEYISKRILEISMLIKMAYFFPCKLIISVCCTIIIFSHIKFKKKMNLCCTSLLISFSSQCSNILCSRVVRSEWRMEPSVILLCQGGADCLSSVLLVFQDSKIL